MKIIVTGAQGQLGQDIVKALRKTGAYVVYGWGRNHLDITNRDQVINKVQEVRPGIIIHSAAYTNVDKAEENEEEAYLVNALGTKYIAEAAERIGAVVCYISTDYVFNGKATTPYKEEDITHPLGVYGKTKQAGEAFIQKFCSKFYIVRTAWLYGHGGSNFVKTMLKLAREKSELGVVHDQMGSPTYTVDLASFIVELIQSDKYGIYHATNSGQCSWYEFANEIFKRAKITVHIKPLTSEEFQRRASRPKYSVLDNEACRKNGFTPLRDWKHALQTYLDEVREGG